MHEAELGVGRWGGICVVQLCPGAGPHQRGTSTKAFQLEASCPDRSSQSPDRHSLGPALVWMMALCIWEASSRVSSPRQGHQRQLGKLRPAEPGSGPTRVASHYTGDSKQWRYVPAMTRGMYTGGFQRTGTSHPKVHSKRLGSVQPHGSASALLRVLGSYRWC